MKVVNKNFSVLFFVSVAVLALLLLRFLPIGIWPWFENVLTERLHISRPIITVLNISIWIIGTFLILLVWLKRKKINR